MSPIDLTTGHYISTDVETGAHEDPNFVPTEHLQSARVQDVELPGDDCREYKPETDWTDPEAYESALVALRGIRVGSFEQ